MDQLVYRDYLKGIAENHINIKASETNKRFLEVIVSYDPVKMDWHDDFIGALKSLKLSVNLENFCFMVLETMQADFTDRGGQNREIEPTGSFIILKQPNLYGRPTTTDWNTAFADTFAVCTDILAYIEEHTKQLYHNTMADKAMFLSIEQAKMYPVGPIEKSYFGTKIDFTFSTPQNKRFCYDATKWQNPIAL